MAMHPYILRPVIASPKRAKQSPGNYSKAFLETIRVQQHARSRRRCATPPMRDFAPLIMRDCAPRDDRMVHDIWIRCIYHSQIWEGALQYAPTFVWYLVVILRLGAPLRLPGPVLRLPEG
jgi:hypothetical protein